MNHPLVYSVEDTAQFNANEYSTITNEIAYIVKQTASMLPVFKEDIIVSYLKDHAINSIWITANPLLAKMVVSNTLPSANIEALFDASRTNPAFRKQFEVFLKRMFQDRNPN